MNLKKININYQQKLNFGPKHPVVQDLVLSSVTIFANKDLDFLNQAQILEYEQKLFANKNLLRNWKKASILFLPKKFGKSKIFFYLSASNFKIKYLLIPEKFLADMYLFSMNLNTQDGYCIKLEQLDFILNSKIKNIINSKIKTNYLWFDGSISKENFLIMLQIINPELINQFIFNLITKKQVVLNYNIYLELVVNFLNLNIKNNKLNYKLKTNYNLKPLLFYTNKYDFIFLNTYLFYFWKTINFQGTILVPITILDLLNFKILENIFRKFYILWKISPVIDKIIIIIGILFYLCVFFKLFKIYILNKNIKPFQNNKICLYYFAKII
jgi:hypothetical protein